MSTRSFIGMAKSNGELIGNYCHYDGYPEHVGVALVTYYSTAEHAIALIGGPRIRCIGPDGEVERFKDSDIGTETFESVNEVLNSGYDYCYLFSKEEQRWTCFGRDYGPYASIIVSKEIPG
jgi:hypothetical protein